jgi:hypothetical protein
MDNPQRIPELRPEIMFLFQLVQDLVDGKIRIPRFQRPFIWRRDQMTDLLDSINRQYPIGSLLAWETDTDIVSLSSVGPIAIEHVAGKTAMYILDGHQRLSTIAGALAGGSSRADLSNDEDPERWNLFYNAVEDSFEHLGDAVQPGPHRIAMSKLLDTFDFLGECQRIAAEDPQNGRFYVQRMQELARNFQSYKIPMIQIKQTGITEAVEIFARLNSKGQAMSADQMVSALLYRQDEENPFNLAQNIDESIAILDGHGFGDIDRMVVLRALLAAAGLDIYNTDWTPLKSARREELLERLRAVIPGVNTSLERATEFLKSELGVTTDRLLPYAMQMTVLSSFFFAAPNPTRAQLDAMKRWFWVSSFTGWFGGANPSRVNALVRDVMDNAATRRNNPEFLTIKLDDRALPVPRSFDMRSARTRALLLVLLSLEPLDRHGAPIRDLDIQIRLEGPEAVGRIVSRTGSPELTRSPANRIFRDDTSDRSQAKNWLLNVPEEARHAVWRSHAVPIDDIDLLNVADHREFLRARLKEITRLEAEFMRTRGVNPPQYAS